MRHLRFRPASWHILITSFMVALLFACSTMPPPSPAKDVNSIAGKWAGFGDHPHYGRIFMGLTIMPDGKWEMNTDRRLYTGRTNFSGTIWVDQDRFQLVSTTPELNGTLILYFGKETRWLVYKSNDGNISTELRPSYK